MVEPLPSEGGEATITAMSALVPVGQYLSTNGAKSTFLRNTGFVVKAILSKLPDDQDMQGQNNVISALQTQVHSLTETLCETMTYRGNLDPGMGRRIHGPPMGHR